MDSVLKFLIKRQSVETAYPLRLASSTCVPARPELALRQKNPELLNASEATPDQVWGKNRFQGVFRLDRDLSLSLRNRSL